MYGICGKHLFVRWRKEGGTASREGWLCWFFRGEGNESVGWCWCWYCTLEGVFFALCLLRAFFHHAERENMKVQNLFLFLSFTSQTCPALPCPHRHCAVVHHPRGARAPKGT